MIESRSSAYQTEPHLAFHKQKKGYFCIPMVEVSKVFACGEDTRSARMRTCDPAVASSSRAHLHLGSAIHFVNLYGSPPPSHGRPVSVASSLRGLPALGGFASPKIPHWGILGSLPLHLHTRLSVRQTHITHRRCISRFAEQSISRALCAHITHRRCISRRSAPISLAHRANITALGSPS